MKRLLATALVLLVALSFCLPVAFAENLPVEEQAEEPVVTLGTPVAPAEEWIEEPVEPVEGMDEAGPPPEADPQAQEEVVQAQAVVADTASRTQAQVEAIWQNNRPSYFGALYAQKPSIASPYAAGSLNSGVLADAVTEVNKYRALAGLGSVTLDAGYTDRAQYGATVLAAMDVLSHTPAPKPADMPQDFFDKGEASCGNSNLSMSGSVQPRSVANTVKGYMDDTFNLIAANVGHRQWIIAPGLATTGFGAANTESGTMYSAMEVLHAANISAPGEKLRWPAAGYMPIPAFNARAIWSIQTMGGYDYNNMGGLTVTLTRARDNKVWNFSNPVDTNGYTPVAGQSWLGYTTAGYGRTDVILFYPDGVGELLDGDVFTVQVANMAKTGGTTESFSYQVRFFQPAQKPVTGINASVADSFKLNVGDSVTLDYAPTPTDADDISTYVRQDSLYSYESGKWIQLLNIDKSTPGRLVVKGLTAGETGLNISIGGYTKSFTVSVVKPVTGVKLNKITASVTAGSTITLTPDISPADASNKAVAWKSSNTAIASVDAGGKVKGLKAGKATITVTTADGGKTASCAVTVAAAPVSTSTPAAVTKPTPTAKPSVKPATTPVPARVAVSKVKLSKKTVTIKKGKKLKLKAKISPAGATNKALKWKSSKPKIVSVSKKGVVKGLRKGKATITVTTKDGNKKAKCTVKVK